MTYNTLKELNEVGWYRAIKIIYFVCWVVFFYLVVIINAELKYIDAPINETLFQILFFFLGLLILESVKRFVYYVIFGKFNPLKK